MLAAALMIGLAQAGAGEGGAPVLEYFGRLARPDGGYGWEDEPTSHVSPTWAAVGAFRLLGERPPRREALAKFIREGHPVTGPASETKPHAAEMRLLTVQQIQALKWLGEDASAFAAVAGRWTKPSSYLAAYERNGYPLFQQEAMAFVGRELLGLPTGDVSRELVEYLDSRRRPDGSFNNTPAADGSGGNVLNTAWGLRALRALGRLEEKRDATATWLRSCQRPSGGFTHAPGAAVGAVDGVDYAWAAILALRDLRAEPADRAGAVRWLRSLWNADGGFGHRPGWPSDPVCTFQALEALAALGALGELPNVPRRAAEAKPLPEGLKPFTIQIQAPGQGSPEDAVELARALRIHLWGAKNAAPGWIEKAQSVARRRNVPVTFFVANEEYGTYVSLPGQGTYSHLSDPIAPAGADFGPPQAGKDLPWEEFLERRLAPLRRAGGRMIWQISDNEEFSRLHLDDSLERGGYAAISTFHMRQNFAEFLPWIYRYRRVLPFVTLQDAHGVEPWCWVDDLAGHRTIFLGAEPTWEAWLRALDGHWVVAVRHDEITRFRTRMLGGAPGVQDLVRRREADWRWWGDAPEDIRRPLVSITAVTPGDRFEAGRPEKGVAFRVRTAWSNNPQGFLVRPLADLVSLIVDGAPVPTRRVERAGGKGKLADVYEIAELPDLKPGRHAAVATIRRKDTGAEAKAAVEFGEDEGSSLTPPVLLPDGREFRTWERPLSFSKTYVVDASHARARDDGPGTAEEPFRTVDRAAQVLQPGERVVVAAGVYRGRVRPRRGGTGPDRMISYEAAPGATVVLKGSRVLQARWEAASPRVWRAALPEALFEDYNPFKEVNISAQQFEWMDWARPQRGKVPYTLTPALLFQDGRRLEQVAKPEDLEARDGAFRVVEGGAAVLVRPFGDADPAAAAFEVATERGVFMAGEMGLGYIRVKGFTVEHAAAPFPMPQEGAISTVRGHHWIIEDNTVREANGVGIDVGNQFWGLPQPPLIGRHIVRRNTVTDCGVCGIAGLRAVECLIEDNVLLRNSWHDAERYYETAAIKTHLNEHTLIRRNFIADTLHGTGIWMDFANVNSRCTGNIVLGTSTIHGGIFIEASSRPNLIDQNVIWDTKGNGIYEHDGRGQVFAHNLIGKCTKAGIVSRGKVTDRKVHGEPIVGGDHRILNNILVENGRPVETRGPASAVEGNLTEGVTAAIDAGKRELTWSVAGTAAPGKRPGIVTHDFFERAREGADASPGPFLRLPAGTERVKLRNGP